MAALPADLRAVMKPMTTYADSKGRSSNIEANVTASIDYLPLLAEFEVLGFRTHANEHEQKRQAQYAYFAAGNSRVKYNQSSTRSAISWWNRSARYNENNAFSCVDYYGGVGSGYAREAYSLAPIFLV